MATPEVWPLLVASDLGVGANVMAYLEPDDDLHTALRRFTAFQHEARHETPASAEVRDLTRDGVILIEWRVLASPSVVLPINDGSVPLSHHEHRAVISAPGR